MEIMDFTNGESDANILKAVEVATEIVRIKNARQFRLELTSRLLEACERRSGVNADSVEYLYGIASSLYEMEEAQSGAQIKALTEKLK